MKKIKENVDEIQKIEELLQLLGFYLELDRSKLKENPFKRYRHTSAPKTEEFALIVYNNIYHTIIASAVEDYLIELGGYLRGEKMKQMLNL